jgi:hypothetical protein
VKIESLAVSGMRSLMTLALMLTEVKAHLKTTIGSMRMHTLNAEANTFSIMRKCLAMMLSRSFL